MRKSSKTLKIKISKTKFNQLNKSLAFKNKAITKNKENKND